MPRIYRFFLKIKQDVRSSSCSHCTNCDLLIAHQDDIEDILSRIFTTLNPEIVGNNYLVIGTVERATWKRTMQNQLPIQDTLDALHDFREVVSFKPAWGWRR